MPVQAIQTLPVIALPNAVLIPGTVLPLQVIEPVYREIFRGAIDTECPVVLCFAPRGRDARPMPSGICGVGTVVQVDEFEDGGKHLIIEGAYRVEILHFTQTSPSMRAKVKWLPDSPLGTEGALNARGDFLELVKRWLFLMGHASTHHLSLLDLFEHPHELADFIVGYFLPDYALKQKLLEDQDPAHRLKLVESILKKGVGWLSTDTASLAGYRNRRTALGVSGGNEWLN